LRVTAAKLEESLSSIPTLLVECGDDIETPQAEDVIGKDAKLSLKRSDSSQERFFSGLVVEADRFADEHGSFRLQLLVAPKVWKLSRRTDCQLFQEKNVPDIVKKVLEDAGIGSDGAAFMLNGTYPPRKHTVQYRESDLDFIARLLAEEGIWFCFDFSEGEKIIFCDDPAGRGDVLGTTALKYMKSFGFAESADYVTKVRRLLRVRSDKVALRDYNFLKPKLKLEGTAEGTDEGGHSLEVYEFPGKFEEPPAAKRYADRLLESLQCERDLIEGSAGVLNLVPGLKFTIEEHPVSKLNAEHLVIASTIELRDERVSADGNPSSGQELKVSFRAMPTSASKYRPPRRPATRTVPGLQTAVTSGPSGEEIHVDEHGRVKVWFHWDRAPQKNEKASDWFRTCQLPTGGSVYLPRMKWETTVDFYEGDIDRPLIFQRMYNALTPPPYELPANKARGSIQTATTPGGGSSNEFRMDDTKGKEEMFFNASKDMSIEVKNNHTETVKKNEKREVGSNATMDVTNSVDHGIGASETVTVGSNQDLHVQTFYVADVTGSHSLTVGGNRDLKVGGDHKHTVKGSSTFTIGGNKIDLVAGIANESTKAAMTHNVGAALVEISIKEKAIVIGGSKTETIGALKLIVVGKNRAVDCGAMLSKMVGGAILTKIGGDRNDNAQAMWSETVAGAQVVKANNVTYEATAMISLVMGGSTLTITPASVMIAGVSVKMDGATVDTGIVLDN
jgi:type VI secretion system secreted protein VgrG